MEQANAEEKLHELSNELVDELIRIAPPTMPEIRFEIRSTPDGGADMEVLDTHPDAKQMQPNEVIFSCCSQYLRLARDHVAGWTRSLFVLWQEDGEWKASVEFKRDQAERDEVMSDLAPPTPTPASHEEPPVSPPEPPAQPEEPLVPAGEMPASSQEPPVSTEEPPVSSEESRVSSEEPPALSEGPLVSPEEPPLASEELPAPSEATNTSPSPADAQAATFRTGRVLDHPPEQVFEAFAKPEVLARWWGPEGFTNTFETFEFEQGGRWKFVMHGPDGANYDNESMFGTVEPPSTLVIFHVSPPRFVLTVTLMAMGEGTALIWNQEFQDSAVAASVRHIVEPANEQNLDRLQAVLAEGPV